MTNAKNRRNAPAAPAAPAPAPAPAAPAAPAPAGTDGLTAQATDAQATDAQATDAQAADAQAADAQAADAQAADAQAADPMELAKQRRQQRLAEARAAKEAAVKAMEAVIKSVQSEPVTKKPDWNLDLKLACEEAPEPIELQDSLKGSYLDKGDGVRYFFRTPIIERLSLSIEQNLEGVKATGDAKKKRNDPMLEIIRAWIADNIADLKGDGAELLSLIDDFTIEEPVRQATLGWASLLVGPQSILNQIALQSGRYALLNPSTGKVKLLRNFYAKAKS